MILRNVASRTTTDLSKLWKWVQYYVNNARLSPAWTQAVLAALAQSYWQGIIAWSDFVKCRRLFIGEYLSTHQPSSVRAHDLFLALTHIGRMVQGRYRIEDIAGFVDQGFILQAQTASAIERLLCLTTDQETSREIIRQIPEINRLTLPFIVHIRSVIKAGPRLYLVLSTMVGQPLPAWLMAQYPMGMPATLAQNLLKQIYAMLIALRHDPAVAASVHPGQLFIDPESLMLQLIPYTVPQGKSWVQDTRARFYQAPNFLSSEIDKSFLGYRLMAIAYELLTGCVPDPAQQQMRTIIKNCEGFSRAQKRQMEYCLLKQMNPSISLKRAAMILDVAKKRPVLDAMLVVAVSLFAVSAITWQGLRYAPDFLAQEPVAHTIVIQQDIKDKHINLLKAAFFTQSQQANVAGARASWQALQQLLPEDDIFVVTVGPEQLANSYRTAAEKIMRQDPNAAGVLVRAALRLTPDMSLPAHVQALSLLPTPSEISGEISIATQLTPEDELSEEIIALTSALIEPLPALPDAAPLDENNTALASVSNDPCADALLQQNKKVVSCMDTLSDLHFGPRLSVLTQQDPVLVMTQEAISVADYNQYCVMTATCEILQNGSLHHPQTGDLDLALNDIEQTVHDYNTYCLVSGLCEPLNVPIEPITILEPSQIIAYITWLSDQTGFVYRLPTVKEWEQRQYAWPENETKHADHNAQWLLDHTGLWTTMQLDPSNKDSRSKSESIAFYLVRGPKQRI